MSKSAAFDNIAMYFPMVQKALARLGVLPHRTFSLVPEFREIFSDIEQIIIDVLVRRQARPKDPESLQESYSGKKKMPTVKNTIITTMAKFILFVGHSFTGHNHDYKILSG
jgi:hypothetical protein